MKKIIWQELAIEIIIVLVMIKPMFGLSKLTGVFYLVAIAGSIRDKSLFTKPMMGRAIVGGTILTYASSIIFFSGLKGGDFLTSGIVLILALFIWFRGYLMKKGVIPKEWKQ